LIGNVCKEAQVRKIWFYGCPEEAALASKNAVERKHDEPAQVRKFGSMIVLKRKH
jgi:hypothetical protein